MNTAGPSESELGRAAARELWIRWQNATDIDDPLTVSFARAALTELEVLQEGTAGVLREALEGAQISAEQLNVESFHGLIEVVQNADDLGAREVHITVRASRTHTDLLIAHDGDRVRLPHVLAMTLAFVSTKREDARAKGRFGIGLKTLGRLGDRLRVHCAPYDFAIEGNRVRTAKSISPIPGFFDPQSGATLLELRLLPGFDLAEFRSWFSGLDASSCLFLDTVRTLTLVDLVGREKSIMHRLTELSAEDVELPGVSQTCRRTTFREPGSRRSWARYEIEKPVPANLRRRHKATAATTPLAVAVPAQASGTRRLSAGLPLDIETDLPISLNAQFDVDTARRTIQRNEWNEWTLDSLSDLVAGVAVARLADEPAGAWTAIPLRAEASGSGDQWLEAKLIHFVESAQVRIVQSFHVVVDGEKKALGELAYETQALEVLITDAEIRALQPGLAPLLPQARDRRGRWRYVLEELGQATIVEVDDALRLLDWSDDDLGERAVAWFIGLAQAAIDANLGPRLWNQRSVVTAEGLRIVPPMPSHEGQLLLRSSPADSLAKRLGIVQVIHPFYLSGTGPSAVVQNWLDENDMLHDAPGPENTLKALAARDEDDDPVHLEDDDLHLLRDAISDLPIDSQRELGPGVGRAIAVDVQRWQGDKRVKGLGRPSEAYLPAGIEERRDGWSKAAGRTPGLQWIHPRYEDVLRRASSPRAATGDRRVLAVKALFVLLGADTAPRLREPATTETRYGDPATPLQIAELTESQIEALQRLNRHATHVKGDYLSPDLVAVVRDIARERKLGPRRERARALIATLGREWERRYADRITAGAVYSANSWYWAGDIPTTWLAHVMDETWMTNELGRPAAPRLLGVRTPATEAIFGNDRRFFAHEVGEADARSPLVRALQIQTDPEVSEMVEQLVEIRNEKGTVDERAVTLRIAAIARACNKRDPSQDEMVGDLTVRQLRGRFGLQRTKPGLVYAGSQWLPPARVLRGAPIFGNRRSFVSERSSAERLWDVLRIRKPTISDCIDVLEEIAQEQPSEQDEQILLNTYSYLEAEVPNSSGPERARLANLPLWTGTAWLRSRPVYALNDAEAAQALAETLPIWQLPMPISGLPQLVEKVGATVLTESSFDAVVGEEAFQEGEALRPRFEAAIQLLRDWLARHDRKLYEARSATWEELTRARLAVDDDMQLELRLERRSPIAVAARAHVTTEPLTFYFADNQSAGADEAGGRALASLFFGGDTDKLALAWSRSWARAEGSPQTTIALAEDEGDQAALEELLEQASGTRPKRRKADPKAKTTPTGRTPSKTTSLPARRLKDVADLTHVDIELVSGDGSGARTPRKKPLRDQVPGSKPVPRTAKPSPVSAPLAYSPDEREELALRVLHLAINGEASDLRDYRHLRGVGADALDKLRRYFEIKASYGPLPDEITLTGAEAERALREGDRSFLAVVAGLEQGYDTVVKIYANPVRSLEIRPNTSVTLAGITSSKKAALEIRFPEVEAQGLSLDG